MVSIFKAPKKQHQQKRLKLTIDRLDHEGRGVCRHHKPVVFVPKTLPGETCEVQVQPAGKRFWQGQLINIIDKSEHRIEPNCQYFHQCGGCQTQYADSTFMLSEKQNALTSLFQKQLGLSDVPWRDALRGDDWHYRRKARLAIDAQHKGEIKIGFRAEDDNTILDIVDCPVLDKSLNALLPKIKSVVQQLSGLKYIGHISLLKGDSDIQLAFRFTDKVDKADLTRLKVFADEHDIKLVVEIDKNKFDIVSNKEQPISITSANKIKLQCEPNDFIQVNDKVNRKMVTQAIDWLSLESNDKVADLFCGLGNFSLALAAQSHHVIGFEGVLAMVDRANRNAQLNGINNAEFHCLDINQPDALQHEAMSQCNIMVLDPSRIGAKSVAEQLNPLQWKKILYVSCHAGTFARDAEIMQSKGFKMVTVSVLDMFPQTSHIELMALFLPVKPF